MPEAKDQASPDLLGFLHAIFAQYGYDLRGYALPSLRRRVQAAVGRTGVCNVAELERKSLADPVFFADVLASLTIRVTEMFRDPAFFLAFRRHVVPMLRTSPHFTVWHAGCATGEEAYSVAVLLAEEGLGDRCQVYATDVSLPALESAKLGIYPENLAPTFEANYHRAGGRHRLDRYLTRAYGRIAICQSVRRNVVFFQHDLVGDHVFGLMDAVFCRNVLIYFGRELREAVVRKLAASVRQNGFLCLGRSEQPGRSGRLLFSDFAPEQRIYRRAS